MQDSDTQQRSIFLGSWLAAFTAIILAITNVVIPLVYNTGVNPPTLLMLRALGTVVVIGGLLLITGRMQLLSPKQELNCAISGFLFMLTGYGLLSALETSPVSLVILVLYLFPLLTLIFDSIVRRKIPKAQNIILLLVALGGLAIALQSAVNTLDVRGGALAFLAATSAAASLVWNNHKLAEVDPEQITFRMFCVSLVIFAFFVILNGKFVLPKFTSDYWLLLFLLGIFAIAFLTLFRAAQMAGSVRASMIMNLEPVASIFLSVIILSESMNLLQYLGAAMVLVAVIAAQFISRGGTS